MLIRKATVKVLVHSVEKVFGEQNGSDSLLSQILTYIGKCTLQLISESLQNQIILCLY